MFRRMRADAMKNNVFAVSSGICWATISVSLAVVLPGCSGSLAVESPAPPQPPVMTAEHAALPEPEPAKTVTETPQVEPQKPVEPAKAGLQPKLTKVDPAQLVGQWKDSFFGTRTLILKADGTARMILDLDLTGRLLYGKRLEFDMEWSVEGAVVTIDILKGTPEKPARSAMNTWGERYVYLLDCVEDHQVEMRDSDGSMNYVLRRVAEDTTAPAQ